MKISTKEVSIKSSRPVIDGMGDSFTFFVSTYGHGGSENWPLSFALFSGCYDKSIFLRYSYIDMDKESPTYKEKILKRFVNHNTNSYNLLKDGYNIGCCANNGVGYSYGLNGEYMYPFNFWTNNSLSWGARSSDCETKTKEINHLFDIKKITDEIASQERELVEVAIFRNKNSTYIQDSVMWSITFIEQNPFRREEEISFFERDFRSKYQVSAGYVRMRFDPIKITKNTIMIFKTNKFQITMPFEITLKFKPLNKI